LFDFHRINGFVGSRHILLHGAKMALSRDFAHNV
jgi:hypothetical protein